jgi:hypothetical protein
MAVARPGHNWFGILLAVVDAVGKIGQNIDAPYAKNPRRRPTRAGLTGKRRRRAATNAALKR